jgi:hypothetical protein
MALLSECLDEFIDESNPVLVLSIFAVDAGCGYFVRERISKKRRELYLESRRARWSRHGSPALGRFLRH